MEHVTKGELKKKKKIEKKKEIKKVFFSTYRMN